MPTTDHNVVMRCAKCPLAINSAIGQFVVCGGPCEKIFHITCANVKMDQLQFLSKNVLWFCDRCLCSFDDWKKKLEADKADSLALARDIATIKTQVADIIETIGSYSSMLSSSPLSTTAVRHSTPIQTPKVLDGTNSRHTFTNEDMQSDVHDDRLQSTQIADDTNGFKKCQKISSQRNAKFRLRFIQN